MKHKIKFLVEEKLVREVTIEIQAENKALAILEAYEAIEMQYKNEKIILDADDFSEYSIDLIDEF